MTTRRDFIKTSGFLVVGFSVAGVAHDLPLAAQGAGPYPDVDFRQLDSWIVIRDDNTATFFVGKTDLGQGTGTAFRQVMADELDMPYDKTSCVMGNTDVTVDQGGSGGSDALQTDGYPMRRVAAEARRVLLEMASARLGVPVAQLVVSDGVVSVAADPSKKVTYGELIGGKRFNVTLTGNNINATTGTAKLKELQQYKIVGTSPPRYDIPPKVDGSLKWAVDAKVPGMVHARNVKPPVAGAKLVSIDESSIKGVPGLIKVVSKGNYVAVVCEREEQAIQAARQLKVNWQKPATAPFPSSEDLFTYMRGAMPSSSTPPAVVGNPDTAIKSAARVIEADYEIPFQGHVNRACARDGGSVERSADDLFQRHEVVRDARRCRRVPQDAARSCSCRLDGGPSGLWPYCRRRCGFRGGVPGEGAGPAGARAVDEERGDGLGYQGSGIRREDAWRPGRPGQPARVRLRGARRRLQSPRVQRTRHGADLSAHWKSTCDAGPRQRGDAQ
jgi:nicotinate dehydrogenase subunit B